MAGKDNSELGRLQAELFGKGLGDLAIRDQEQGTEVDNWGHVPGLTYAGGPQTQQSGAAGRRQREISEKISGLLGGVDIGKYLPYCDPVILECWSRMIETTFRDFQQHVRLPSSQVPPFTATPIDAFPLTGILTVAPAATVTVVSFTMPKGRYRGVIGFAGQSAESAGAFTDLRWDILVDGVPRPPWTNMPIQLWQMVPPTPLCAPIQLQSETTVALRVRNGGGVNHFVLGRLCGWFYPTRAETGDGSVRATIVD